jgi:hypothetical protein
MATQTLQQPFAVIHQTLQAQVEVSEAQVRVLYYERYLPLVACHERQRVGELERVDEQVGLLLTLNGLAPKAANRSCG